MAITDPLKRRLNEDSYINGISALINDEPLDVESVDKLLQTTYAMEETPLTQQAFGKLLKRKAILSPQEVEEDASAVLLVGIKYKQPAEEILHDCYAAHGQKNGFFVAARDAHQKSTEHRFEESLRAIYKKIVSECINSGIEQNLNTEASPAESIHIIYTALETIPGISPADEYRLTQEGERCAETYLTIVEKLDEPKTEKARLYINFENNYGKCTGQKGLLLLASALTHLENAAAELDERKGPADYCEKLEDIREITHSMMPNPKIAPDGALMDEYTQFNSKIDWTLYYVAEREMDNYPKLRATMENIAKDPLVLGDLARKALGNKTALSPEGKLRLARVLGIEKDPQVQHLLTRARAVLRPRILGFEHGQ